MSTCIVCNTETSKYKCPKCYSRYCSVTCCRTHKESCSQKLPDSTSSQKQRKDFSDLAQRPSISAGILPSQHKFELDDDADKVPEEMLRRLGENKELKSLLVNPHLQAMLENVVNTDKPDQAMAQAMQEPIFTEFADVCLQIVDGNNPNLEPQG